MTKINLENVEEGTVFIKWEMALKKQQLENKKVLINQNYIFWNWKIDKVMKYKCK
jgi:hypothetical protein